MAQPDPDDIPAEHPRKTAGLVGHAAAERHLAQALAADRLGHAWLISGPRGVGKATLAFRLARRALASRSAGRGLFGDDSATLTLDLDPEHPVFRRVASAGHADLRTVERRLAKDPRGGQPRLRREIVIEDIRALGPFFALTPAEGGRRVAIVDAADEMNRHAANALLKLLEEPPTDALLILVAHVPGRLPATIRSRCRHVRLSPLGEADLIEILTRLRPQLDPDEAATLARIAEGSPGRALMFADRDGAALSREIESLLAGLPEIDMAAVHAFGDRLARRGEEDAFATGMELLCAALARHLAATARGGPRMPAPLRLDRGVELWENIGRLAGRTDRLNLDRKQVVLNAFAALENAASS